MKPLSLARVDVVRLAGSKRWLGVLAIWCVTTILARAQCVARSETLGLAANIWDLRLIAVNNWMYLSYLLLTGFVFLVGDTIVADRTEGWAAVSISRCGGVWHWWTGKAVFLIGAAALYQVAFLAFTLVFGIATGLPLAMRGSQFALAPVTPGALFVPLASPTALFSRLAASVAHETLGFAAITMLLVTLCIRGRRPSATAGAAVALVIVDWVLAQRLTLWEVMSPGRHLLEGVHFPVPGALGGVSWTATIVYLAFLLVAGVLLGGAAARGLEF